MNATIPSVTTVLKILYIVLFLLQAFFPRPFFLYLTGLVALALCVLTFPATRRATRIMSVILCAAGAYLMLEFHATPGDWIKACIYNTALIALLLSVPMLSSILFFEPYETHLSRVLSRHVSSPFRFYSVVSLLLTVLASLINLAGFHFVHQLLRNTAAKYPARLFNSALIRGFLPNMMWSPSYISVAFVVQYTSLSWFDIAPLGIAMASVGTVVTLAVGWIEYGRQTGFSANGPGSDAAKGSSQDAAVRSLCKLLFQTGLLILLIVLMERLTHKSAMVIVPLVAFAGPFLLALAYGKTEAFSSQARDFFRRRLPAMNNEVVLFSAIGFFGYSLGLSDIPSYIPLLVSKMGLATPAALLPLVSCAIGLLSVAGVHPMITIATLAAALPPGSIPASSLQLAGAFLSGYVLYSILSPFSSANLLMSSLSGQSPLTLGLKQNGFFAAVFTAVTVAVILLFP